MNKVYELCPHCMTENEINDFNPKKGYVAKCQGCGKEIMICSECLKADDNQEQKCDWNPENGCFRKKEKKIVSRACEIVTGCMNAENVNQTELANRMGIDRRNLNQILYRGKDIKFDKVSEMLDYLGYEIRIVKRK